MKVVFAYVMSCCLSCLAPSLGKVIDVMAQTCPLPREGLTSLFNKRFCCKINGKL